MKRAREDPVPTRPRPTEKRARQKTHVTDGTLPYFFVCSPRFTGRVPALAQRLGGVVPHLVKRNRRPHSSLSLVDIACLLLLGPMDGNAKGLVRTLRRLRPYLNAMTEPVSRHHHYHVLHADVPGAASATGGGTSSGAYIFPLRPAEPRQLADLVGHTGELMAKVVSVGERLAVGSGKGDAVAGSARLVDVLREILVGAAALPRLRFEFAVPVTPHFALIVDWFCAPRLRRIKEGGRAEFVLDAIEPLRDVMEYILAERADVTASVLLSQRSYQCLETTLTVLFQTAYSVCAANQLIGFVHGDLHLDNVMVRLLKRTDTDARRTWRYDVQGRTIRLPRNFHRGVCVKVIDFGRSSARCSPSLIQKLDASPGGGSGGGDEAAPEQDDHLLFVGDHPWQNIYGTSHQHDLRLFALRLLVKAAPWLSKAVRKHVASGDPTPDIYTMLARTLIDMAAGPLLASGHPVWRRMKPGGLLELLADWSPLVVPVSVMTSTTTTGNNNTNPDRVRMETVREHLRAMGNARNDDTGDFSYEAFLEALASATQAGKDRGGTIAFVIDRHLYSHEGRLELGTRYSQRPAELLERVCDLVDAATRGLRDDNDDDEADALLMGRWSVEDGEEADVSFDDDDATTHRTATGEDDAADVDKTVVFEGEDARAAEEEGAEEEETGDTKPIFFLNL